MQNGPARQLSLGNYLATKLSIRKNCKPFLHSKDWHTCGTAALTMLTGLDPKVIEKGHVPSILERDGLDYAAVRKILTKHGYSIYPITKSGIRKFPRLRSDHCLLIDGIIDPEENSWLVMHKGTLWHNFHVERVDPLYFFNNPTECVYLVWHPKWGEPSKFSHNYRPTRRESHLLEFVWAVRSGYGIRNL